MFLDGSGTLEWETGDLYDQRCDSPVSLAKLTDRNTSSYKKNCEAESIIINLRVKSVSDNQNWVLRCSVSYQELQCETTWITFCWELVHVVWVPEIIKAMKRSQPLPEIPAYYLESTNRVAILPPDSNWSSQ